jgi:23S rRNA pseudouridine955/2504/2580 synthase
MKKYYLALCQGKWRGNSQIIDVPLKKNTLKSGERLVRVDSEGKEAKSRFSCKQRFKMATLMDVEIFTGRTHQIRVHAAHAGHPLAGDDKYGDKSFNQEMKKRGLKRLFLHAAKLSFSWEKSKGGRFEIQAPMDKVLEDILDKLR